MAILNLIGIGVDCEEMSRFEKLVKMKGFVERTLSKQEVRLFQEKGDKKIEFLAGRFVAKESIIKALSSVVFPLDMRNISITKHKNGSPRVQLSRRISGAKKISIDISISHCSSLVIAFCVAQWVSDTSL